MYWAVLKLTQIFECRVQRETVQPEAVARRCSVNKGVLRNFAKFTGKHLPQSLFFNKVAIAGVIKK